MLDVVLVAVNAPHPANLLAAAAHRATPLGAAYLGAALARAGLRVALIDMNAPPCPSDWVVRFVAERRPRLIGLACATESAGNAVRLARRLRAVAPEALLATGGPHWTFLPEAALASGAFDVVALREGDATVVDLAAVACGGGELEGVPGIVYAEPVTRAPVRTAARPLIADLDALPFPARDLFTPRRPTHHASVLTGRGCPGRCAFCSAAAMSGGRRRARSAENVVAELAALREVGVTGVLFVDDTLTADLGRLSRLLDLLAEAKLGLTWACESRVDTVSRELFARMADLGCVSVQFGVESGSQELLDAMGKGTTLGQVEQAVGWAAAAGISPVCSFIIGHPGDTERSVAATVEFAAGLQARHLARCGFALLVPFPGTRLWRRGEALGLRRLTDDFDAYNMHTPVCETDALDAPRLRALQFDAALRMARETGEAMSAMLPFLGGGGAAVGAGAAGRTGAADGAGAAGGTGGMSAGLAEAVWRDWY